MFPVTVTMSPKKFQCSSSQLSKEKIENAALAEYPISSKVSMLQIMAVSLPASRWQVVNDDASGGRTTALA